MNAVQLTAARQEEYYDKPRCSPFGFSLIQLEKKEKPFLSLSLEMASRQPSHLANFPYSIESSFGLLRTLASLQMNIHIITTDLANQ